jgi:hypothetical protein
LDLPGDIKMARILLGTSPIAEYGMLGYMMSRERTTPNVYIGASGSSILAACLAMGFSYSHILDLYEELSPLVVGFDWNQNTADMLVHTSFNIKIYDVISILKRYFGHTTFMDRMEHGLEILSYNLNKGAIETFNVLTTPDMELTTAITLSINLPGFYTVGLYQENTYIDVTVVCRYPNHAVAYDWGVYSKRKYHTCIDAVLNAANEQYLLGKRDIGIVYTPNSDDDHSERMIRGFFNPHRIR